MSPTVGNAPADWTEDFERVRVDEHARIALWRAANGRAPIQALGEPPAPDSARPIVS